MRRPFVHNRTIRPQRFTLRPGMAYIEPIHSLIDCAYMPLLWIGVGNDKTQARRLLTLTTHSRRYNPTNRRVMFSECNPYQLAHPDLF